MKNKTLLLLYILLQMALQGQSQQVSQVEYYFNNDPGTGNGIPLAVGIPGDSIDVQYNIPVSSLTPGGHILYVRSQDAAGRWSLCESRAFSIAPPPPASEQIVAAEYFFDNDPGTGNGVTLTIGAPGDSIDALYSIPVTGLAPGGHLLYIRSQDISGKWSLHESRAIQVTPPPSNQQIVAAEYFFDSDPGVGNGTSYNTGPPSDSLDVIMSVTVPSLSLGNHLLYIRTKNGEGQWSLAEPRPVNICATYGADANFSFDVIGNSTFFHNSSSYVESRKWIFGDGQEDTVQVNPRHDYATGGVYTACLVASSACGKDTFYSTVNIHGIQTVQPNVAGQTGLIAVRITGFGFETGTMVKLVKAGQADIAARTVYFINTRELKVSFALQNAAVGLWSLVAVNPLNGTDTLFHSFEIQPVKSFEPWVQIIGPSKVLVNRSQRIRIAYGNKGNTTAFAVPVYIRVSGNRSPLLLSGIDNSTMPQAMLDTMISFPSTHFAMYHDSLTGDSSYMAGIVIPVVEPGLTKYIDITVHSAILGRYFVEGKVLQPLFTDAELDSMDVRTNCNFLPPCWRCLLDFVGVVPGVGCVTAGFSLGCSIGGYIDSTMQQTGYDILNNLGGTILGCVTPGVRETAAFITAHAVASTAPGVNDAVNSCVGPGGCGPAGAAGWTEIPTAASLDPNIKDGPTGMNAQNFISGRDPIHYRVFFENSPSASAPASEVFIVDTLDTSTLDLSTFYFTQFGFGDSLYLPETNRQSFTSDIDLRPNKNIILRVHGNLDLGSGIVTCKFSSFDPITMALTDSVDDGFLPPNINGPEGEGFVGFSIRALNALPHLQAIHNAAQIYFDSNAPIATPDWLNTLDIVKPQSAVSPIPVTQTSTAIQLQWGGSDSEAGVMDYAIYFSDNNAPYEIWVYGVKSTSGTFIGQPGHVYKFYSVARDYAMNMEDSATTPDAQTSILTGISSPSVDGSLWMKQNIPNPFSEKSYVEFYLPAATKASLSLTDISGRLLKMILEGSMKGGIHTVEINSQNLSSGIYFLKLVTSKGTLTRKINVLKN